MTSPNTPQEPNKPDILKILEQGKTPDHLKDKESQIEKAIKSDVESLTEAQLQRISTKDFLAKVLDEKNTNVFGNLGKLLAEDIGVLDDESSTKYMGRVKSALSLKIREQLKSSPAKNDIKIRLNELLGAGGGLPNLPGRINFGLDKNIVLNADMIQVMTDEQLIELRDNTQLQSLTVFNSQNNENEAVLQRLREVGSELNPKDLREWLIDFTKVTVENDGDSEIEFDLNEDESAHDVASKTTNLLQGNWDDAVNELIETASTDKDGNDDFTLIYPLPEEDTDNDSESDLNDDSLDDSLSDYDPDNLPEYVQSVPYDTQLSPDDSRDTWTDLETDAPVLSDLPESYIIDDPFGRPVEQSNAPSNLNIDDPWIDTNQARESQVPEIDALEMLPQSDEPNRLEKEYSSRPQAPQFPHYQVMESVQPSELQYPQDNPDESTPPAAVSGWDADTQPPQSMDPQVENTEYPPGEFTEEYDINALDEALSNPIQPAAPESSVERDPDTEHKIKELVDSISPELGNLEGKIDLVSLLWRLRPEDLDDLGFSTQDHEVSALVNFFTKPENSIYMTSANEPIIRRAFEYYNQILEPELKQVSQGEASPQTPQSPGPSSVQPVHDPSGAPERRRPARRTNLEPVAPTPPLDLTTVAGRREALERQPELMAMAKERFYRDLGDIFSRSPKYNIDDAVAHYLNEAEPGHKQAMAMALGLEFDITDKTFHLELESVVNAYNQRYFSDQGRRRLTSDTMVRADLEELALDTMHHMYGWYDKTDQESMNFRVSALDQLSDQQKVALAIYYNIRGDLTQQSTINKLQSKIVSEQQAHGLIQPDGFLVDGGTNKPLVNDIYFDVMSEFHAEDLRKPEIKAKIAKMVSMRVMQEKLDLIQAKYDEANAPKWFEDFGKLARVAAPGVLAAMMFSGLFPTLFVGETVGAGAIALLKGWGSALVASEGFALSTFGYIMATGFFATNAFKHGSKLNNPFGNIKKQHTLEENLMTTLRGGGKLMTSSANGELQVSNVNPEAGMQRRQIMDMKKKWKQDRMSIYHSTFKKMSGDASKLNSSASIYQAIIEGVNTVNVSQIDKLKGLSKEKIAARTELGFSASMMGIPSLLGYAGKKMFT